MTGMNYFYNLISSQLMKKILLLICPIIFVLSCNKYEDGPSFSLHTKTHRLANSWIFGQVFETPSNGTRTDRTDDYKTAYYEFNLIIDKGNTYSLSYSLFNLTAYTESGTWVYNGDKTHVYFNKTSNSSGSGFDSDWTILKLKEKELWAEETQSNGTVVEMHLIPRFH
jgi:hypothetical protein